MGRTLAEAIAEIDRQKELGAEYVENAKSVLTQFVENNPDYSKRVVNTLRRWKKDEDQQRIGEIRALLRGARELEMFAQVDAFDDLLPLLRELSEELDSRSPPPETGAADEGGLGKVRH